MADGEMAHPANQTVRCVFVIRLSRTTGSAQCTALSAFPHHRRQHHYMKAEQVLGAAQRRVVACTRAQTRTRVQPPHRRAGVVDGLKRGSVAFDADRSAEPPNTFSISGSSTDSVLPLQTRVGTLRRDGSLRFTFLEVPDVLFHRRFLLLGVTHQLDSNSGRRFRHQRVANHEVNCWWPRNFDRASLRIATSQNAEICAAAAAAEKPCCSGASTSRSRAWEFDADAVTNAHDGRCGSS
jgi:hypothetical protein